MAQALASERLGSGAPAGSCGCCGPRRNVWEGTVDGNSILCRRSAGKKHASTRAAGSRVGLRPGLSGCWHLLPGLSLCSVQGCTAGVERESPGFRSGSEESNQPDPSPLHPGTGACVLDPWAPELTAPRLTRAPQVVSSTRCQALVLAGACSSTLYAKPPMGTTRRAAGVSCRAVWSPSTCTAGTHRTRQEDAGAPETAAPPPWCLPWQSDTGSWLGCIHPMLIIVLQKYPRSKEPPPASMIPHAKKLNTAGKGRHRATNIHYPSLSSALTLSCIIPCN